MQNKLLNYEKYLELNESACKIQSLANIINDYCSYNCDNEKCLYLSSVTEALLEECKIFTDHF